MTSAQFMRSGAAAAVCLRVVAPVMMVVAAFLLSGCGPRLVQPAKLQAPYEVPQVWAIAPFANESGVSLVETDRVADHFVQQLQDVRGINAVPVNRVIVALRELELPAVRTAGEARAVMNAMGVDGLIVGTVTAYDPYRPMTFGAAIELHLADRPGRNARLDTRSLSRSVAGEIAPTEFGPANPVAQAAGIFDASNHETLAWLDHYATGRSVPESAYGKDIYLVRMDMYTQFVSYRLLRDLLNSEWNRVRPIVEESPRR